MPDLIVRFLIGGFVVSAFAVLGDMFRPKSFAGLFGAAPSIALATLTLVIIKDGRDYASVEARSMIIGAIALGCYCQLVSFVMMRLKWPTVLVTTLSIVLWFLVAFTLWKIILA